MKKEYTVALFNDDYEHVEELVRRGRMRRYFQGAPKWHQKESIGVVFGGLMSLGFGFFIPILLGNSGLNPSGLKAASFVLILGGAILLIKGYFEMGKDSKQVYEEVPDEEWEKCLTYDMQGLKLKAKAILSEKLDNFINEVESIEDLETLLVTGPDDWASNPNLPMLMTLGEDGTLRSSNLSVMIIFLGNKHFYVYQASYNMRSGSIRREHAYTCKYEDFLGAQIREGEKRTLVTDKKIVSHRTLEFVLKFKEKEQEIIILQDSQTAEADQEAQAAEAEQEAHIIQEAQVPETSQEDHRIQEARDIQPSHPTPNFKMTRGAGKIETVEEDEEDKNELSLVISDIDTEEGTGGKFDIEDSKKAVERMTEIAAEKINQL